MEHAASAQLSPFLLDAFQASSLLPSLVYTSEYLALPTGPILETTAWFSLTFLPENTAEASPWMPKVGHEEFMDRSPIAH